MKLLLCVLMLAALAIPEGLAASKTAPKTAPKSADQVRATKAAKKSAAKKQPKKAKKKVAKKERKKARAKRRQASRVKLVEGKNTVKFAPPPASRSHAPKSEFPMLEGESLPPPEIHEED